MPAKLSLVGCMVCWLAVPGNGQPPPTTARAAVDLQAATRPAAPAGQRVAWEQMSVGELLGHAEQFLRQRRANEAVILLALIERKDPANLAAKVLAGEAAEMMGNMARARQYYRAVLAVDQNNFRANLNMGRSWVRARMWHQAQSYLETAASVAPQGRVAEAQALLAVAYQGQVKRDEAITAARAAVAAEPDNPTALQVLIAVNLDLERYDEALSSARRLVEVAADKARADPANLDLIKELYTAYDIELDALRTYHRTLYVRAADGRPTDRVTPGLEREAASTLAQIIDVMLLRADLARTMTHHDVLGFAQRLVKYAPNDPDCLLRYGLLLRETGQNTRALEVFKKILTINPNNTRAQQQVRELESR